MKTPSEVVLACYAAYENCDRDAIEGLLADDFTFTSPIDDHIDRDLYMRRCWPNSEHLKKFHITHLFAKGNEVFVRYKCEPTSGEEFRNTEFFTVDGEKLRSVEVFFGSEDATSASEAEIRSEIAGWAENIRQKDAPALASHFTSDPVRFDLAAPLQATMSVEENAREWFATFQGNIGYEIRGLSISVDGDLAMVHSFNLITGTKIDGEKADLWFRETLGLKKIDGRWLIAHMHESVPFSMDGRYRAEVDLQPPDDAEPSA
jgi:ketosteroid isomerase-like protein